MSAASRRWSRHQWWALADFLVTLAALTCLLWGLATGVWS